MYCHVIQAIQVIMNSFTKGVHILPHKPVFLLILKHCMRADVWISGGLQTALYDWVAPLPMPMLWPIGLSTGVVKSAAPL